MRYTTLPGSLLLAGACLVGCGTPTTRVLHLVVRPEAQIQDLTGSRITNFLDWVQASPEVVERTAVVEFSFDVMAIEHAVDPSEVRNGWLEQFNMIPPWDEKRLELAGTLPPKHEVPAGIEFQRHLEPPAGPYQQVKQRALAALREWEVRIDGRQVDLAQTALLDGISLYSHLLLGVGPHEIRAAKGEKVFAKAFSISERQPRLVPTGVRRIRTKEISTTIHFWLGLYHGPHSEPESGISIWDYSDGKESSSPFRLYHIAYLYD